MVWKLRDTRLNLTNTCLIMGIINLDSSSFSGDGCTTHEAALAKAELHLKEGAHLLDVGAASSKPGSVTTSPSLEWSRLRRVVEDLAPKTLLSIDTTDATVAALALKTGAHIINDVSGAASEELLRVVAREGGGYVLMRNLRGQPKPNDDIEDLTTFFQEGLTRLEKLGISEDQVVLDPGLGFGRDAESSLDVLQRLRCLVESVQRPVLIGASRKGFVARLATHESQEAIESASARIAANAANNGARILRVHNVARTRESLRI